MVLAFTPPENNFEYGTRDVVPRSSLSLSMRFVSSAILRIVAIAIPVVSNMSANPGSFTAFKDGETFTYRASWGIFFHAGEIVISAHEEKGADGAVVFRITTDTATRGIVRDLFAYNNRAEGVIDQKTGRLLQVSEKGSDGKHFTDNETTFDYARMTAHYVDRAHPGRTQDVPIPAGDPVDLISALVGTRDWNLKPGEKREVLVNFGNEFFPIALCAEAFEEVRTPLGTYPTLLLLPRMEKNPKGIFKQGGQFKVWISQSGQKLPVKMQLKLAFGSATLLLTDYKKPAVPVSPKSP